MPSVSWSSARSSGGWRTIASPRLPLSRSCPSHLHLHLPLHLHLHLPLHLHLNISLYLHLHVHVQPHLHLDTPQVFIEFAKQQEAPDADAETDR